MTDSLPTPDLGALAPALLALLQADDVMVSIKAVDGGRYVWANPALCAFLGVDAAGVAGRTDLDTLPAADAQAWR
ncbi:MAG: PAS domain-containing protein, partial [Leptothrix sp. (in: b-proteobacteria)]